MEAQQVRAQQVTYVDYNDGTAHNATITFTNPKAQAITYTTLLYLALPSDLNTPINTPVSRDVTIAAQGISPPTVYNVTMPFLAVSQAQYTACLKVSVGSTPIVTFVGTKIVRVTFTPGIGWGDIIWGP